MRLPATIACIMACVPTVYSQNKPLKVYILAGQSNMTGMVSSKTLDHVKMFPDTAKEFADLFFAFTVAKHVKSNTIVYAKDGATVGIGAGQMSRVDSVEIALQKAGDRSRGAVLASDAFFPFADSVEIAHQAGVKAVVQPGGSIRDQDSIDYCDAHGLAMVFTGIRHFKH